MDIDLYRDLFVHRTDVYAVQQPTGAYFPAGAGHWEETPDRNKFVYDQYFPLDDDAIAEHLAGHASYGTYVIEPALNTVKFIVFDLDTYDQEALRFLQVQAECLIDDPALGGYECLMLESSGGKGYHIWLFLSEPVPARNARAWTDPIKRAYRAANPGDWPALEIFPKQDVVDDTRSFGNLVKLPFGVHAVTGNKSEIVPCQGWANRVEDIVRLNVGNIPDAPEVPVREFADRGCARSAPFACVARIIEEGAGSGVRNFAMLHLAHYLSGTGLTNDQVKLVCEDANQSFDPPLDSEELRRQVQSALDLDAPHPSCSADWLEGFCPGGEKCYAPWNTERPRRASERAQPDASQDYLSLSPQERRERRIRERA